MEISELYRLFCEHPEVTTDTRSCSPGAIFFALRGASFNGNAFAAAALQAGCSYAVVDEQDAAVPGDPRFIVVEDALSALQQLAAFHRRHLGTRIVQITGTNGKTTTKELTAAVLRERFSVLSTQGNFNNHIGVPKTLLRLRREHDIAVVETGANHPGEIAQLTSIVGPDCGLITNVGKAHLEGFGSFEGVVKTKGELYDYFRHQEKGLVFLHADDALLASLADGLPRFTYGAPRSGNDVEGEVIACAPFLHLRWRPAGDEWLEVRTHLVGAYNLCNVLAAAAVGTRFGVPPEAIVRAVESHVPDNDRSELKTTERNLLIVDAYNANPTSMKAALDNFSLMRHPHKMAILGEMRELGAASAEEHRRVAEQAAQSGCEAVWFVGEQFASCDGPGCLHFSDVEAVKKALQASPVAGRLILVKGSNATKLYELPEML